MERLSDILEVTGAGSAECAKCNGKLDYSWFVRFTDGRKGYYCSADFPSSQGAA